MDNLQREVYEDWTIQDFIDALSNEIGQIMTGGSCIEPFKTKQEMIDYIVEHQPYYKKPIPEVNEYFANLYGFEAKGENNESTI